MKMPMKMVTKVVKLLLMGVMMVMKTAVITSAKSSWMTSLFGFVWVVAASVTTVGSPILSVVLMTLAYAK
jgi:hypothetical protein